MPKYDLLFEPPLMNAAGTLGFAPQPHAFPHLAQLGLFITNPISLRPRPPAGGRRFAPAPGGFLLHTGYPNPGIYRTVRRFRRHWARSPLPVAVHLLALTVDEVKRCVQIIERVEGVYGIELGLPPEVAPGLACELVLAAAGELPVIVRLPLERAADLAQALADSGAPLVAASLAPPRGILPDEDAAGANWMTGRFYGPAVFPLALAAVQAIVRSRLPVIGAGGVYSPAQAQAMRAAGALAVQLDSVLWRGGYFSS